MCIIKMCLDIFIVYVFLSLSTANYSRFSGGPCGSLKAPISEEKDCYIQGIPKVCPDSFSPGTDVMKKCRPPYNYNGQGNVTYTCFSGKDWEPSYDACEADCGKATSTNKYPWIVGVYDSYTKEFICPGIIISTHHLVTAAQCLPSLHGSALLGPHSYTIIAGKHYTNRDIKRNSEQERKLKKVIIHEDYTRPGLREERDIALWEVDKEFEFFDDVRPVCIDWESLYEEQDFRDGNNGTVVGLGNVEDVVVPCESPEVKYWQKYICWENLPRNVRELYFGYDKICGEYINDKSACNESVSTGLFFKSDGERYFLRGITSVISKELRNYVLYTKVSNYLEWLKVHMRNNTGINRQFKTPGFDLGNSTKACLLPQHPQYGKFHLITGDTYPENIWVPSLTNIVLSCDNSKTSTLSFHCSESKWQPTINNDTCKKPGSCPSLVDSESEKIHCTLNGSPISCNEPPTNATAVIVCEPFHIFSGHKPIYKCQNGKWDPPFISCSLECGKKRVGVTTLAIGAREALMNEYPWVVAIYNKDNLLICGGTLISRYYVLSAAHCFTHSKGAPKQKDEFTIIAGKYFRNISSEESGEQKRKIKFLHIHENYRGSLQKYRDDIALIELDEKFTASLKVQPVCIDWEGIFQDIDFTNGKMGVITGWGFTEQAGSPSNTLRKLIIQFQPKDICLANLPNDFSHQYYTDDKFCAGSKNTGVCKGDSGGGLCFLSDGVHYYVRGIASLTSNDEIGCDINHFSLYTKVSNYLPWIGNITRHIL